MAAPSAPPAPPAPPAPSALSASASARDEIPASYGETSSPARLTLEALLRERKLDRTLTTALPAGLGENAVAPFGLPALDARLLGGIPRGHLSEIAGDVSSGRTSLAWAWLGAATRRGETVALIDTFDRFDPASAVACGIDLTRMLWVRGQALSKTAGAVDPTWLPGARAVDGPGTMLERTIDRALKALNLVLQARVCTAVVLDIADVPVAGLRRIPMTTWLRVERVVEGSDTACLLLAPMPLARSAAGVTITTGAQGAPGATGAQGAVRCTGTQGAASPEGAPASEGVRCMGAPGPRSRLSSPSRFGEVSPQLAGNSSRAEADVTGAIRWAGAHDRSRRVSGVDMSVRLSSPRRTMQGEASVHTHTLECEDMARWTG